MQKNELGNRSFRSLEFILVVFLLGIIIYIGAPKYQQYKLLAWWCADEATIRNIAKTAELYAASRSNCEDSVTIQTLINCGFLEKNLTLVSRKDINGHLIKNEKGILISNFSKVEFTFNKATGCVNNFGEVVKTMIGEPPHRKMPTYPGDKKL